MHNLIKSTLTYYQVCRSDLRAAPLFHLLWLHAGLMDLLSEMEHLLLLLLYCVLQIDLFCYVFVICKLNIILRLIDLQLAAAFD